MADIQLSQEWMQFVRESEALTGIIPFDPGRTSTKRHIEICRIIAGATCFVDPRLVNGMIAGKHAEIEGLMRTGTEGALRNVLPNSERMRMLLDQWTTEAQMGTGCGPYHWQLFGDEQRSELAWTMHDRLICIHPFKTGNGRTARLMLNHIRTLIGLPVLVIADSEAPAYYQRLERYRDQVFIPARWEAAEEDIMRRR